ncbi:putative transmembrane protein 244 isoform 2-T2 [Menidia menidia]
MLLDYCCRCCGFTLIKRHGPFSLKTAPSDTLVVLQNLLMCMVCFYSLYYIVVSLCIGLFSWSHFHRGDVCFGRAGVRLDCGGVGLGLCHNRHTASCCNDCGSDVRLPFSRALVDRPGFWLGDDDLWRTAPGLQTVQEQLCLSS